MTALLNASASASQATELSLLVELEARWENLRGHRSVNGGKEETTHLQQKQKAYEAFHDKLAAYNKTFKPEHVPERLLNTPVRLGEWCRKMRDLLARSAQSPKTPYPVHLFEKAYRSADRIADVLHKDHAPVPPRRAAQRRRFASSDCWPTGATAYRLSKAQWVADREPAHASSNLAVKCRSTSGASTIRKPRRRSRSRKISEAASRT